MPSARAHRSIGRLGVLAVCGLLLLGAASGCSTTQDTAARKQVESKQILKAREKKRRHHD